MPAPSLPLETEILFNIYLVTKLRANALSRNSTLSGLYPGGGRSIAPIRRHTFCEETYKWGASVSIVGLYAVISVKTAGEFILGRYPIRRISGVIP